MLKDLTSLGVRFCRLAKTQGTPKPNSFANSCSSFFISVVCALSVF